MLPTNFFKSVFHFLAADVLNFVNVSLISGTFPKSLKTAVLEPLVEKEQCRCFHIEQFLAHIHLLAQSLKGYI